MHSRLDAIATLLDQGAADSAVRLLRGAWEPELPPEQRIPMYCLWIRALCETGELAQAMTLATRAAEEFPTDVEVMIAYGNVLDLHGELELARDAFARACELAPGGALQHYDLGAVQERLGELDAAEASYRRALAADEDAPLVDAHAALGALLRRQGRLDEAEEIYDTYLSDDPTDVDILVEHGICLSDLDRLDEALERFDEALALDPDHASGLYNKAITLWRMGRATEATEVMFAAHEADPDSALTLAVLGAWLLMAPADLGGADLDEALGLLYRAVDRLVEMHAQEDLNPHYAGLVCEEVFEALWQAGRRGEARDIARRAGQLDWITPHMLETLNRADHGAVARAAIYRVVARAQDTANTTDVRPEHWPADAAGYTTDLEVIAEDEEQARALTLDYLRAIEASPRVAFDVRVVEHTPDADAVQRARGVVRVESSKAFFRA